MEPSPRILRSVAPAAGRRLEGAVYDADQRVREMVAAAEARARRLVEEAEAERARLVAEARAEGLREAEARAAATLAAAAGARDRLLAAAEQELAALALAVARQVLGRELSAPGTVASLAAAALAEARDRREVVLRVSPADAPEVHAAGGGLGALLARAPLAVREDPSLGPGDVVVETEGGRIDARLEAQLDAVARALAEALP
jgi:flagellar biosynthesis/type III secretory pathway protein FliH